MKEKYSILRSADRFIEQRQYKKAIKVYLSLIDSGENDPSVINSLGDLQYRDGDSPGALKSYFKAAKVYSDSGDSMKAVGLCRKILRIDPSDDASLDLFLELNSKRDAVFDSVDLLNELVRASLDKSELKRAAALQERLLSLDSESVSVKLLTAELQFLEGKTEESTKSVHKAVDRVLAGNPESDGWKRIGKLLATRQSREDFREFVEGMKDSYVPSGPEDAAPEPGVPGDTPDDAAPSEEKIQDEALTSPEFFEVDSSISTEEEIELQPEEIIDDSFDFQAEEEKTPPPPSPPAPPEASEESAEEADLIDEVEDVEELLPPAPESGQDGLADGQLGDAQEFELNLDEEEIPDSPEEFLELLEAESQAATPGGESGEEAVEEPSPEYEGELEVSEEMSPGEVEESAVLEEVVPEEMAEPETAAGESPEVFEDTGHFEVSETSDIPEELIPEELDLEITASSEPDFPDEGGQPGGEDDIEYALESIFVSGETGDQPLPEDVPEAVSEKEYIGTDRSDPAPRGESIDNPEEDPNVQLELGIAYRDMALLEDAVIKYENALELFEEKGDKDKCVRCCQLLSEGYNVLEQFENTLRWVNRGLNYHDLTGDEIVSFEYESAVALEALGDFSESLKSYRRIQSIHPGFRDVENRISSMESSGH